MPGFSFSVLRMVGKSKNVSSSWPRLLICNLYRPIIRRLVLGIGYKEMNARKLISIASCHEFLVVVYVGHSSVQNQNVNSSHFVRNSICECFGRRKVGSV